MSILQKFLVKIVIPLFPKGILSEMASYATKAAANSYRAKLNSVRYINFFGRLTYSFIYFLYMTNIFKLTRI